MNKNSRNNGIKIIISLLVFIIVLIVALIFRSEKKNVNVVKTTEKRTETVFKNLKKAIIIVPGIGCSTLHYLGKTNNIYKHGECIFFRGDFEKWSFLQLKDSALKALSNYKLLSCNYKGEGVYKNVGLLENYDNVDPYDIEISKYGFSSMFKNLILFLEKNYGKNTEYNYDIFLFNYDWRLDINYNGKKLYNKLKEFDDGVIIIAYSMGNLITCSAAKLLYEEHDIDRIKLFLSTFPPYNGSVQAINFLKKGIIDNQYLFNVLNKVYKIDTVLRYLTKNYASMYQLMPNREFSKRNKGFLIDSNNMKLNYRQAMNYLRRDKNFNKKLLNQAIKFHESLYIEDKHILNYIKNKYFFLGSGYKTGDTLLIDRKNIEKIDVASSSDGDGTVNCMLGAYPPCECDSENIVKVKAEHIDAYKNEDFLLELVDLINIYVW